MQINILCIFVILPIILFNNVMSKKCFILAIIVTCLLCQCGQRHEDDDKGSDYPSRETFAIIDSLRCKNRQSEQLIETTQQDLTETKEEVKVLEQKLEKTKQERTVNNTQQI